MTPSLRSFDEEMAAVSELYDEVPGLKAQPIGLSTVSDLPWTFADYADVISDEDNYGDKEHTTLMDEMPSSDWPNVKLHGFAGKNRPNKGSGL